MFGQSSPSDEMSSLSMPLDSKRAHRLSKPRTITGSSSSLTLKSLSSENESDTPNSQSSITGEKSNVVVVSPGGDSRSRRDSRRRMRAHLFGLSQESLQAESEEENENKKGFVDTAREVRDRLSRTGTMVSRRASLRISTNLLNTSQARLSLVPESSFHDVEDPEQVIDQIKEKAFHDSLAAMNHVSSPVDEDMHVDAVASPIRRRSLFTPGLATRVPDDILRKPPPPQRIQSEADRDYYYNPSRPESSPLAKIAALELGNRGGFFPVPRASTPSDMDYAHLGGLRPGTLRIMNGNNSPIPRIRSPSVPDATPPSSLKCGEDYFNRTVPRYIEHEELQDPVLQRSHYHGKEIEIPVDVSGHADGRFAENGDFLRSAIPTTNAIKDQRTDSPLMQQARQWLALDYEKSSCKISKRGRPLSLQPIGLRDRTSSLAQDYRSELPDSPFITTEDTQVMLSFFASTSKRNEFDDKLFDDDASVVSVTPEGCPPGRRENLCSPQNANRFSNTQKNDSYDDKATRMGSQVDGDTTTEEKADDARPVYGYLSSNSDVTKVDSGYDSSVSSESMKRKALTSKDRTKSPQPPLKSSLKSPRSPPGPRHMPQKPASSSSPVQPMLLSVPTSGHGVLTSSSLSSSETVPTLASSCSTQSQAPYIPRKLKKSRPLSLPPPSSRITVQSCREIDCSTVPPVPAAVAAKHAERLQSFPLLDHTFPSSHHTCNEIVSTSPDFAFVPIRFPSPTKGMKDEEGSFPNSKTSRRFSLTRGRRLSLLRRNHTFSTSNVDSRADGNGPSDDIAMTDFGDVSAVLGDSPYDAARYSVPADWRTSKTSGKPSPHHMTTANPRAKVGMGEEQAAEFARLRSQNRSESLSRVELESLHHTLNRSFEDVRRPTNIITELSFIPPMPALSSRSVSSHGNSFNDRGGIPGKMPRPKSMNAPPMPPLPSKLQVQEKDQKMCSGSNSVPETTVHLADSCSRFVTQEENQPEHPEKDETDPWVLQRQAWAERRRTAIEGLQIANSSNDIMMTEPPTRRAPSPPGLHLHVPSTSHSRLPLTPPQSLPTSKRGSMTSLKDHEMPEGNVHRLSGRFDGGLSFLYEPGCGVGGSAGTRNMRTGASRKSVEVSLGYGIDLSDVPIFIAPSS
ncbi:hypothetical protein MMC11_002888 [Xylographa trunciseda]|nr:hypothetical protein [Xylographa trunciseda]